MRYWVILALALSAFGRLQAAPLPRYAITDLGSFVANGMNNRGQVIGEGETSSYQSGFGGGPRAITHAVLWQHGKVTDLGSLPPYPNSSAAAINDAGQIVGTLDDTTDGAILWVRKHPFLWQQGKMRDLGSPHGDDVGEAVAINDAGDIVGGSSASGRPEPDNPALNQDRAFLSHAGLWNDLGMSWAGGINNRGQIAGSGVVAQAWHALLWEDGRQTDLGLGNAVLIDIHGRVVIQLSDNSPDNGLTLWERGSRRPLPGLSGWKRAEANGINDRGQIVGCAWHSAWSDDKSLAVTWLNGNVHDLNASVPTRSGWLLTEAVGINNRGQIVGNGLYHGRPRAFLLTPRTRKSRGTRHMPSRQKS